MLLLVILYPCIRPQITVLVLSNVVYSLRWELTGITLTGSTVMPVMLPVQFALDHCLLSVVNVLLDTHTEQQLVTRVLV